MWCGFIEPPIQQLQRFIVVTRLPKLSRLFLVGRWRLTSCFRLNRSNKSYRTYIPRTYTFTDASISFTALNPDESAPCIHEDHAERCSPAKWIRSSAEILVKKSLKPTNAHAPRDHSSSIQHLVAPRSKFSFNPPKIPSNCVSVVAMRSFSLSFVIFSASPGLA